MIFSRYQCLKTVLTNSSKAHQLLEKVLPNISECSEKYFMLTHKQLLRKTINAIIGLFVFLWRSLSESLLPDCYEELQAYGFTRICISQWTFLTRTMWIINYWLKYLRANYVACLPVNFLSNHFSHTIFSSTHRETTEKTYIV